MLEQVCESAQAIYVCKGELWATSYKGEQSYEYGLRATQGRWMGRREWTERGGTKGLSTERDQDLNGG